MNQAMVSAAWPHEDPRDPMISAAVDDFTTFLDLVDFPVSFPPSLDPVSTVGNDEVVESMDLGPDGSRAMAGSVDASLSRRQQQQTMAHASHSIDAPLEFDLQPHLVQHQQRQSMPEQPYHPPYMIPPTPNSIEMQGGAARYYQHTDAQAQALYYQQMKDDQMVFTPLVSPAVTPLEAHFSLPEFTVPGAYLSPLTSPALDAQQPSSHHRAVYHKASRSDASIASSSVEMLESMPTSATSVTSQPGSSKRIRKTSTAGRPPARVVRQSPSMKPQRRKAALNNVSPSKDLAELVLENQTWSAGARPGHPVPPSLRVPSARDSSESESISPEPLSEALMAPPPAPRSVTNGQTPPAAGPETNGEGTPSEPAVLNADGTSENPHPATPASLMRLQKQAPRPRGARGPALTLDGAIPRSNEQGAEKEGQSDATTPVKASGASGQPGGQGDHVGGVGSARKTPTFKPLNTSASALAASPLSSGLTSPSGVAPGKKLEGKGSGRAGARRTTSSSVHVSPALRPRISPSIKPLLPEGATLSAETSALLLASKSNYQNILEGNHLPGVSYPEALSTNLTSKRTSHKIAEQGRRNRINQALQEIANLLPAGLGKDCPGSGGEGVGHGGQPLNSKASTVEMAIEYIKMLQRDLGETKEKLEAAEKKLESE